MSATSSPHGSKILILRSSFRSSRRAVLALWLRSSLRSSWLRLRPGARAPPTAPAARQWPRCCLWPLTCSLRGLAAPATSPPYLLHCVQQGGAGGLPLCSGSGWPPLLRVSATCSCVPPTLRAYGTRRRVSWHFKLKARQPFSLSAARACDPRASVPLRPKSKSKGRDKSNNTAALRAAIHRTSTTRLSTRNYLDTKNQDVYFSRHLR